MIFFIYLELQHKNMVSKSANLIGQPIDQFVINAVTMMNDTLGLKYFYSIDY